MWALKNNFLVSTSTMYLNFDRRKTRFETVLHTLLICESQRSLLSMVIPRRRCSDTWSVFAPFRTRSSGKGDKWCFCLVAIVIDLVLIGLMTKWLLSHQLDTWSKLSCTLLLICIISFPDVYSVVSSASTGLGVLHHHGFWCSAPSQVLSVLHHHGFGCLAPSRVWVSCTVTVLGVLRHHGFWVSCSITCLGVLRHHGFWVSYTITGLGVLHRHGFGCLAPSRVWVFCTNSGVNEYHSGH